MGHPVCFVIMVKLFTASVLVIFALAFKTKGVLGQATCGDNDVVDTRIVGGDDAVKHSIPWQVAIVRTGDSSPFCGGTIIDSTHILTAAHCTENLWSSQIQVVTGEHDTSDPLGDTRHNVKSIVEHPSYNIAYPNDYDISILTIDCDEEIDLSDKARAACLPESDAYHAPGARFNVSGWGWLSWDGSEENPGSSPDFLKVVTVPYISDVDCQAKFGRFHRITEQMICAGNVEDEAVCKADSGGPLTWKDAQGKWNVIGVVSWGLDCHGHFPQVYVEVFTVLDWVKSNSQAGGNEQCDGGNPPIPTTSAPSCKDKWSTRLCRFFSSFGQCIFEEIKNECQKTCDACLP